MNVLIGISILLGVVLLFIKGWVKTIKKMDEMQDEKEEPYEQNQSIKIGHNKKKNGNHKRNNLF